ncbi:GNAT family N-acetyltransferase [Kitasatospora sp. NBC_01266]|uniref:GNAT family N-acetyltransferase n=1 Tax=Kitasatospora sp. NBC_01266 TaxID=2903572 RepID=UPI002E34DAC6|nr:GNAT family N-acetyltransferase [Kitasatospora sp. NBC_01266]
MCDTLAAVPAATWAALATGAGLYFSHEWLSLVEQETPGRCRYLLAHDGAGIAGALPVYLVAGEPNPYYDPQLLFRAAVPGRGGRYCVAGSRSGYSGELLLADRLTQAEQRCAVAALLDELAVLARAEGQQHAFLLYLNARGLRQVAGYAEDLSPVLSYSGDAWLEAPGRSFDDYLAGLASGRRWTVRKEVRRFAEQGLTAVRADPRERLDLIVEFARLGNEKYGIEESEDELRTRFERQCAVLGEHGVLIEGRRGETVVGMALSYRWEDRLYLRMAGFDQSAPAGAYPYFNLVIYESLRYCYETGLRGVHLGTGSHDAKSARGARIGPLASVALPAAGAAGADPAAPTARSGVRRYWQQQVASRPHLVDRDLWRPWLDL